MEGNGMNHYRKMKQRQRAHLGSMGRKRDTMWQRDNIGQWRGDTGEEKREETMSIGLTRILLSQKNEENPRGRFSCFKWTVEIKSNNELIFF
jgi:hypothetical protein